MTTPPATPPEGLSLRAGSSDAETVRRYYDDWAGSYDETLQDWDYRAPNDCADGVVPGLGAGARVLDVGCGTGLMGAVLAARVPGVAVDGTDISQASLDRAGARGVYDRLVPHDLQRLPLPFDTDAYDAAVCVGVLTYVPDAAGLVRDMARCVRPGGAVAFTQRSDRWESAGFPAILAALQDDGTWRSVSVSDPLPYLPGNDDFGDAIRVIHVRATVS